MLRTALYTGPLFGWTNSYEYKPSHSGHGSRTGGSHHAYIGVIRSEESWWRGKMKRTGTGVNARTVITTVRLRKHPSLRRTLRSSRYQFLPAPSASTCHFCIHHLPLTYSRFPYRHLPQSLFLIVHCLRHDEFGATTQPPDDDASGWGVGDSIPLPIICISGASQHNLPLDGPSCSSG